MANKLVGLITIAAPPNTGLGGASDCMLLMPVGLGTPVPEFKLGIVV